MGSPDPERRAHPILPSGVAPKRLDGAPPAQVMIKILGGDAMERAQPLFEPAVVTIDVVDMQVRRLWSRTAGFRQDTARNFRLAGEANDRLAAVATELIVRRDHTIKSGRDGSPVEFGQHGIRGPPAPVPRDQDRNLLGGQASLTRLAAAFPWRTRQAGALALERFPE